MNTLNEIADSVKSDIQDCINHIYASYQVKQIDPIAIGISRKTYSVIIHKEINEIALIIQSYLKSENNFRLNQEYILRQELGRYLDFVDPEIYLHHSETGTYLLKRQIKGHIILNPPDLRLYCFKLAEVMYAFHLVPTGDLGRLRTVGSKIDEERDHTFSHVKLEQYEWLKCELSKTDFKNMEYVLVHGDFWSGNILWDDGEISAVIDWEDALIGSRLYDIAIARFELYLAFGSLAMDYFTQRYEQLYQVLDFDELKKYELIACFRVVGGITGWTSIWKDYDRPDVSRELFYERISKFIDRLK